MSTFVGSIELDAKAGAIFVGRVEFDALAESQVGATVFVGKIEFDVRDNPRDNHAGAPPSAPGGLGSNNAARQNTTISSPQITPKRYDDSFEQDRARAAANEQADEEAVLAFLLQVALQ